MRILIVDTLYERFLSDHYEQRPELAAAPYAVQWQALMDRSFGTSDAYSHFLGDLGHRAHEVIVNCDQLQLAWAREHKKPRPLALRRLNRRWRDQVLLAQAEDLQPDVVYVQDVGHLSAEVLAAIRLRAGLLVGQLGTAPPGPERLKRFDLLVTSFPQFVPRLRELGVDTEFLGIGFDPRVLDRLGDEDGRALDAAFVGALSGAEWREAGDVLARVADRTPIEFWGYGIDGLPNDSPVRARYRGEAWGLDMYRIYHRARVVLNRHGDIAEGFANNMRLYEATGVGALLVTEAKENLADLFTTGREIVTYHDADEAVEQIRHYLANEDERVAIARAGQARTLHDHTYAVRMTELAAILYARLH